MTPLIEPIVAIIEAWVSRREDLIAAALVGSWARGEARADSDVDLVLLASDPRTFRAGDRWLQEIDWLIAERRVRGWKDVDYGAAWSRHVRLEPPLEIEFTFASPAWAAVDPVDEGTRRVVSDGCRIIFDPAGLLARLQAAVAEQSV